MAEKIWNRSTHIDDLPDEVLELILKRVNDKTKLTKVCERWGQVVDRCFGIPLKISVKNLGTLSTLGVSHCDIQSSGGQMDYFMAKLSPKDAKPSITQMSPRSILTDNYLSNKDKDPVKWKYSRLLTDLWLRPRLNNTSIFQLLLNQPMWGLNKLQISWVCLSQMNTGVISKLEPHLVSLNHFKIFDDDSFLRINEIITLYANILEILKKMRRLKSIDVTVPEPRTHKVFTKIFFDFLQQSPRLTEVTLEFDEGLNVSTAPWNNNFQSITAEDMELQAKSLSTDVNLVKFKFIYMGKRLQEDTAWINLLTALKGLVTVHVEINRKQHIPITVPSRMANNNAATLESFTFLGGPRFARFRNFEEYCLDFNAFRPCKELQLLDINCYENSREILHIAEGNFPPKLHRVCLANFIITFEEILAMMTSMTVPVSTLNLEEIWLGTDFWLLEDEPEDTHSTEYLDNIKAIAEKVIEMENLVCFSLGRLHNFPKAGISIGPPENRQILRLNANKEMHMDNFKAVNYPEDNDGSSTDSETCECPSPLRILI